MVNWLMSTSMRSSMLIVIGLAVAGCAQIGRVTAVSAEDTGRARVLEIPDARFLPSDATAMRTLGQRLYEREVKYFAAVRRPVSPENLLALSGGGDNGAFGAGLLVGWSESGTRPPFKVVTGISTGALIAPFAFLGSDFDPILREIYTTIEQKDIFERRPLLAGLASDALADCAPLEKLISKYLDERIVARLGSEYRQGRALIVITTNLDAGVPVIWNISAIAESGHLEATELIRKILLASASIPALFPPVMFNVKVNGVPHQELHVDGGASMQTFLYPASLRIAKIGTAGVPRRRMAYIIRNGRFSEEWNEVERSTLSIANRAVAILTTNSGVSDLYRMYALAKRDGVGFRLAFIDNDFTKPHPTEFDRSYMTKLFEYGRAKARAGYPWLRAAPSF
jgi:predicted acylesterase/phospholipase RssA